MHADLLVFFFMMRSDIRIIAINGRELYAVIPYHNKIDT